MSNKKHKHRLYLDVTFSEPVTHREAAKGTQIVLDRLDLEAQPVWACADSPYIDKLVVVEKH